MSKKDNIKLGAISNIDEKIIDEVTGTRIALSKKVMVAARKRLKRLIAIGSAAASFILVFTVFMAVLGQITGPGSDPTPTPAPSPGVVNVPVYQGMTIKQASSLAVTEGFYSIPEFLSSGTEENEVLKEDIEELVDIDVVTDDEIKYYVKQNEVFIIAVHISNPNDYEIQSFTLNGKKYANYMFKEGSTMEELLLEVTAPDTSGYIEYTIDAIKYIDGTEIKDVDMSSGDKSIKAGVAYPTAPSASVTSRQISTNSLALSVNISDPYSLIGDNELAIYLSDGERIVDTHELSVGENTVSFNNLLMSKTYEYGIVAVYDLVDGNDVHLEWLLINKFTTLDGYAVNNIVTTKDGISFEIGRVGEIGTISSVSLYDAVTNELVKTAGADTREFSELLSNHTYNIYVDFTYTVDGTEIHDRITVNKITTLAKVKPTVAFTAASSDKVSVTYGANTTDTDGILNIEKVELLQNGETIRQNGVLLSDKFDGLLSNTKYTVKISYSYDLNDGQGVITETVTKDISTLAKALPIITFDNVDVTDTKITGNIEKEDADAVGAITSVDIYKGEVFVNNNPEKKMSFSDLEYYTDYRIAVSYSYDLNDGKGEQTATAEYKFKTAPHLAFNNFTVINTSAVSEGETIFLQVNITNPNRVVYQKIVVNGNEYDVVKNSSTETMLICEIVNRGQFEGGNTTLTIEKVIAELGGTVYTIEPQSNNTASVFINGRLEVEEAYAVVYKDGAYVKSDYIFPSDTAYLQVKLHNKTGYNIDSVTISSTVYNAPIKLDDEHYLIEMQSFTGWSEFTLTEVKYSRENLQKTASASLTWNVFMLESDDIVYVSSADDLLNMNSGAKYYELTGDIDLSGREWRGNDFYGVLNGKGYSIINMSYVGTITNSGAELGLFTHSSGVIENLYLKSVRFIVNSVSSDGNDYNITFGGITAVANGYLVINSCSVDENSIINIDGNIVGGIVGKMGGGILKDCVNSATVTGNDTVGGIVGEFSQGTITGCVNNGAVSGNLYVGGIAANAVATITECTNNGDITGNDNNIGGIAGHIVGTVVNCTNNGDVVGNNDIGTTGSDHVGGIVGSINGSAIVNCVNNGSVSGHERVGGITGDNYATMTNCINNGFVKGNYTSGSLVGYNYNTIENCVNNGTIIMNNHAGDFCGANDGNVINSYSLNENANAAELSSKQFYTETLGFDETVWSLDDLDVANGKYPQLK